MFAEARCEAVLDDDEVLAQEAAGSEVPTRPAARDSIVPTAFTAWSGRELRDEDGLAPGFYVAAGGPTGWRGCTCYYSPDGATWSCGEIPSRSWGTALGAWHIRRRADLANTVAVQMQAGELAA